MSVQREDEVAPAAIEPRKARRLYWLISLPLAGVLLYFALRGVDWHRVWQIAAAASLPLLALGYAITSVSYLVRALRWRILLRAGGDITFGTVFWSNSSGYLANNFLPARTGEILRSAMISGRSKLSKTYVLTTALSERMLDALALISISAAALITMAQKPAWLAVAARPFAVIAIGGAIALAILPRIKDFIERTIGRLPLPEKFRLRLTGMTEQILLGIRTLHNGKRLAGFVTFTALIWFLDAASAVVLARALGLTFGFPIAFLMLTGIGLSSALPSTPGNVGVYQFVTVSVLVPFGIAHSDALAYALIGQASNYIVVAFWGLLAVWRYNR
jgi:uncharacterized protein (TIRG00374 family)